MKRTLFLTFALIVALTSASWGVEFIRKERIDVPNDMQIVPDEFVVRFQPSLGEVSPQSIGNLPPLVRDRLEELAHAYDVKHVKPMFRGAAERGIAELSGYHRIRIAEGGLLEEAMAAYSSFPWVESVEPIGIHPVYATPNDTWYADQWHLNQASDNDVDAPEAWDIETGDQSVIVAMLDTGVRYYHKDLGGINASWSNPGAARGNMWINLAEKNGVAGVDDDGNGFTDDWVGWDFVDGASPCWTGEDCNTQDNDPRDFNGHGTHCAGNISAMNNNGYATCAPTGGWGNGSVQEYGNGVKVMACRVGWSAPYLIWEVGYVRMDYCAEAFYYAADNGAKIASCSWGSSNSGGIGAAVTYFVNNGGLVFKAAGNDGSQTADYLCSRSDVISVAATDQNDCKASFSTYGTWVDISAPGVGVYSLYHNHDDDANDYVASMDGTSMATPLAASVAALIWSRNPGWTAAQVQQWLYDTADDIDGLACNSSYAGKLGAGRINAYNAVSGGTPPPAADFTGSPRSGCAPLTVSFTDLSTGDITSWSWSFGDGGTSSAQNPSHTYTSAGIYTVSLTVAGPGGSNAETKANYVTVGGPPVAAFVGSPTSGTAPLTVNFTDQSAGNPTGWGWTFGDGGTSSAQNPSHTYTTAGTYTVTLTASNSCGSAQEIRTDYITVNPCQAPVAEFVGSPRSGDAPLTVSFTDQSTGSPASWSWTFGDGGTSSARNPSHTYTTAGTYTVSLTATNSCGSDTETKTDYITVTACDAPVADFAGSPRSGEAPLTVSFSDQSTGATSWSWSFGDGGTSSAQNPSHTYTSAGTYTVSLTATNSCGSDVETKAGYITVTPQQQQCDDFADGDISDWGNRLGTWTATGGYMKGNSSVGNARITSPFGSFTATTINCDVRMNSGQKNRRARILFSYVDGSNYRFIEGDDSRDRWYICQCVKGRVKRLSRVSRTINTGQWYGVAVDVASNGYVTLSVDGVAVTSYRWPFAVTGLVGCGYDNSNSDFDDFCVGSGDGGATAGVASDVLDTGVGLTPFNLANTPNPFTWLTDIAFTLPEGCDVQLAVYDVAGRRVRGLASGYYSEGTHLVPFDGTDDHGRSLPQGIYFYCLKCKGQVESKKMLLWR